MKAHVLERFNEPLVAKDVPEPRCGPGEVKVRVRACGVCGTDVKIVQGLIPAPIITLPHILGHEVAGDVVEVGEGVEHLAPGERVVVYFYLPCGWCDLCRTGKENICYQVRRLGFERPGGFGEFVTLPAYCAIPIPTGLDYPEAAILPDAVAVPFHALRSMAQAKAGQVALIVGAGGLGLHAVQIASAMGLKTLVADISPQNLSLAKSMGAEVLIDASSGHALEHVMAVTESKGADVVLEMVGSPQSMSWTLPATKRGGTLVIVGYSPGKPFPLDTMAMHYHEWRIVGSRVSTKQDLIDLMQMVRTGKVRPYVAQVRPWEDANEVLSIIREGKVAGRLVLKY